MEVAQKPNLKEWFSKLLFREPKPFTTKRDVNWSVVKRFGVVAVVVGVFALLLMPASEPEQTTFHEKADPGTTAHKAIETDPTQDTWAQLQQNQVNLGMIPSSFGSSGQESGGRGSSGDRNTTMVLVRSGMDSKNQLPPGTRISVRLFEKAIVSSQSMPVIGIISKDVVQEDGIAIPQGSKLFGEMSFEDSSERAQLNWRSVQFPDGRERQMSAIGMGQDGQVGVEGKVHSNATKNAIGQTITRFIGAYAEGSMERGMLGASQGGHENGLKSAVAETAKDRANAWGEDLKKEKKWIELNAGAECLAVLNQAFSFRDPGAIYGR